MSLHSDSLALLGQINRPRVIPYHLLDVASMRHEAQKLQFAGRPESPVLAEVHEIVLSRPDGPPLRARYYRGVATAAEARLPVLLYFHGGGWCVGDLASFDVLCRQVANFADCAVVSVDYRLAPEHPFPVAVEDACFAFSWLTHQAAALRLDETRIAVGGDSAGGNLAAVAAIAARDAGGLAPCFQLLVYPVTDQRGVTPSHTTYGEGLMLTRELIARFQDLYLPHRPDRLDWRASPALASSHAGLPPASIITAEYDPLVDDARAYASALSRAGVPVELHDFPGMVHGFFTLGKFFRDANTAVELASAILKKALRERATR